ncbi:hypothetical protein [Aquisphaera insulae]|uniref:hypothetical protein n=1 Tax=Aquisphaera insulae TaxID=2712864 RepID=UPI0013EC523C|nr:hypothetical protein [Aquisphaera insulae]
MQSSQGPNLAGIDPETENVEILFNPRRQAWEEHFEASGPYDVGKTATGRVTVRVLAMNEELRLDLRRKAAGET